MSCLVGGILQYALLFYDEFSFNLSFEVESFPLVCLVTEDRGWAPASVSLGIVTTPSTEPLPGARLASRGCPAQLRPGSQRPSLATQTHRGQQQNSKMRH